MARPHDYDERRKHNDKSRNRAEHHSLEWESDEVQLLLELWPDARTTEDEAYLAECLGRTIEACRQKFYMTRAGANRVVKRRTTTTTQTTVTEYMGTLDDPEDRWWSPDYYTGG